MVKSLLDIIHYIPDDSDSDTFNIIRDVETLDQLVDVSNALGIDVKLEKGKRGRPKSTVEKPPKEKKQKGRPKKPIDPNQPPKVLRKRGPKPKPKELQEHPAPKILKKRGRKPLPPKPKPVNKEKLQKEKKKLLEHLFVISNIIEKFDSDLINI